MAGLVEGRVRAELLEPGADDGVGRLWRYTWRSRLPYDLTFESRVTRREPPYLLEGDADGELIGVGRWRISKDRRPRSSTSGTFARHAPG